MDKFLVETVDGLPNLCGSEELITQVMAGTEPMFLAQSDIDFSAIQSAFSIGLHMYQPLIPAGSADLATAAVISNLRFMAEHSEVPDAHNAPVFRWCYKRTGEFIPQLVREGKSPRVMLDFSGCLLFGLRQMGADDVIDSLRPLARDPAYRRCVEWLGTAWGHAVAPSTPVQDFRLHVRAWQHQFAGMFGLEALGRVRGFSPPEMALPNHPEVCYEFVKTLLDCGYRWVLVQEDSVERFEDGGRLLRPHMPHRLIARNSRGQSLGITAIIKTQGSDTKLVAQMQPYYQARNLARIELGDHRVPQLVTQIGDGENGGVMMNEFPSMFMRVMAEASGSVTPALNGTEYLEHLAAAGVRDDDLPMVRPIYQKSLWDRLGNGTGPAALASVIDQLHQEDNRFHMEGGSWTADISWVRGYDNVLTPMADASALFAAKAASLPTNNPRYRKALFYLLLSQTSCFRYWGQGTWTDYGRELCRRASEIIEQGNI